MANTDRPWWARFVPGRHNKPVQLDCTGPASAVAAAQVEARLYGQGWGGGGGAPSNLPRSTAYGSDATRHQSRVGRRYA